MMEEAQYNKEVIRNDKMQEFEIPADETRKIAKEAEDEQRQ